MKRGMKGMLIAGGLLMCLVPVLMICVGILGFSMGTVEHAPSAFYLKDELGIDRDAYTVLHEQDSHGGFHGDGLYAVALDCADRMEEMQALTSDWQELPLTENLELLLYGGEKDGWSYAYDLAEETAIPQIENGCYFFNNRHSRAIDSQDDDIFSQHSFNLSLAIFDRDQDILYLLCYDT